MIENAPPVYTVGLILFVVFVIWEFRFVFSRAWIANTLKNAKLDWLSDNNNIHRIQFEIVDTTPSVERMQEIQADVAHMVTDRNYRKLSDYLTELDQDRVKCPAQRSLSIAALRHFADLAHIEGNVGLDTEHGLPARLEAECAAHSDCYGLVAMTAMLRLREAWAARGEGYADSISKGDWKIIDRRVSKAQWLLSRVDPTELNSPLLAYCRFQLLAFIGDADRKLLPYYREWSKLDPICQMPHEEAGFKLLPRWFGDLRTLEETARQSAFRTRETTGMSAYYKMFQYAVGCDPIHLVIDPELYIQGAIDLLDLRGNDPAAVGQIFHEIATLASCKVPRQASAQQADMWDQLNGQLFNLMDDILAYRVSKIYAPAWDGGYKEALNRISHRFRAEMDNGCHFVMDENGITVLDPPQAPIPA